MSRGFALVSVLWGVALLSLLAAGVATLTTNVRSSARFSVGQVEAKALATAAVNDTVLRMVDDRMDRRPRVDGVPFDFRFAGQIISVSVQDESGKVDLNTADWNLLRHVFSSQGLSMTEAEALADHVSDWRDIDNDQRPNGAEAGDYRMSGRKYLPRNAPFQRVDELRLVMGVRSDFFSNLAPLLTVHSHRPYVNTLTAPEAVRAALQGMDGSGSSMIVNLNGDPGTSSAAIINGVIGPMVSIAGWSFTIRAEVPLASGSRYVQETVVSFTSNRHQPYWIGGDQNWWERVDDR
jgi:general secretion pathway protein K